jgi:hypothetical protein
MNFAFGGCCGLGAFSTPSHKNVKHVLRFNARLYEGVPEVELAMV